MIISNILIQNILVRYYNDFKYYNLYKSKIKFKK